MEAGDGPIFVLGHERSGTTLLQALLGAHPRIAAPPETYFLFRVAQHAAYLGDLADDANLDRALREALDAPGGLLEEAGFDHARVLARAARGPRTYAGLLDAIMGDFAERHGKARWSEKSPGQPIELAADLFPQAQFVHIVRDPRDVVASSLRTPWAAVPDAGAIARSWRDYTLRTVRRGFALGPARFLQIRYEDLTRDPAAVLELVCAFLGEPYAPAMVDDPSLRAGTVTSVGAPWQQRALAGIVPAQEGRWREQLGRRQKASVHAVVAPVLAPLGYDATAGRLLALSARLVRAGEPLRRLRTRRQAPPPSSPEELYRRTRAFTDAQAARIA